jgi:hypothetical protein
MSEKPAKSECCLSTDEMKAFMKDVAAGLSDAALCERYRMARKTLVLYKMAVKDYLRNHKKDPDRTMKVSASEVCEDLKTGLDDTGIMTKYNVTYRQLQSLYRKIIQAGLLGPMDLAGRLSVTRSQILEAFTEAGIAGVASPGDREVDSDTKRNEE